MTLAIGLLPLLRMRVWGKKCESIFENLAVTQEQAKNVEVVTCAQALSKVWFRYRTGRITASRFKAAAHTDLWNALTAKMNGRTT